MTAFQNSFERLCATHPAFADEQKAASSAAHAQPVQADSNEIHFPAVDLEEDPSPHHGQGIDRAGHGHISLEEFRVPGLMLDDQSLEELMQGVEDLAILSIR